MKNAILKICEALRGYSDKEPYFEVVEAIQTDGKTYTLVVKVVEGTGNESN